MLSVSRVCEQSEMMGLLERTDEDIETRGVWKEEMIKAREEDERKRGGEEGKERWKTMEDGTRREGAKNKRGRERRRGGLWWVSVEVVWNIN